MTELKVSAEAMALCLEIGLVSRSEVTQWAAEEIQRPDAPIMKLADLATADRETPQDVAQMLRDLPGVADRALVVTTVMRVLRDVLRNSESRASEVARALYALELAGAAPDADAAARMRHFDDAVDLARTGVYGDLDSVVRELREFLEAYGPDPS